jgi:hypothetical protein
VAPRRPGGARAGVALTRRMSNDCWSQSSEQLINLSAFDREDALRFVVDDFIVIMYHNGRI